MDNTKNTRRLCGVGYLSKATSTDNVRAYTCWSNMIKKCYKSNSGKAVVSRWHSYDNFLEDLDSIDGYNSDLFMDKQIYLVTTDNVYSKETCLFKGKSIYNIGDHVVNLHGQHFTIIDKQTKEFNNGKKVSMYKIQFDNTGTQRWIDPPRLYRLEYVKDTYAPSVYGVGYLGTYTGVTSKVATTWRGMLDRCYNPKHINWSLYGGNGVTVCDRWHCLSNFAEDIAQVEGYNESLFLEGKIALDKDSKQEGVKNKVYSKDTCVFLVIPEHVKIASCKEYKLTEPNGEVHMARNLKQFCAEHDLKYGTLKAAVSANVNILRNGWKIEKIE